MPRHRRSAYASGDSESSSGDEEKWYRRATQRDRRHKRRRDLPAAATSGSETASPHGPSPAKRARRADAAVTVTAEAEEQPAATVSGTETAAAETVATLPPPEVWERVAASKSTTPELAKAKTVSHFTSQRRVAGVGVSAASLFECRMCGAKARLVELERAGGNGAVDYYVEVNPGAMCTCKGKGIVSSILTSKHICSVESCGRPFSSAKALGNHVTVFHSEEAEAKRRVTEARKIVLCTQCAYTTTSTPFLLRHTANVHGSAAASPVVRPRGAPRRTAAAADPALPEPQEVVWKRLDLTRSASHETAKAKCINHFRKSIEGGAYYCSKCGAQARVVEVEENRGSGEAATFYVEVDANKRCRCSNSVTVESAQFICTVEDCGRPFSSGRNLKRHVESYHTEEAEEKRRDLLDKCSRHKCASCPYTTADPRELRKHISVAHPEVRERRERRAREAAAESEASPALRPTAAPVLPEHLRPPASTVCACGFVDASGFESGFLRHLALGNAGCRRMACYDQALSFQVYPNQDFVRTPDAAFLGTSPVGPSFTVNTSSVTPHACPACPWFGLSNFAWQFHVDHCRALRTKTAEPEVPEEQAVGPPPAAPAAVAVGPRSFDIASGSDFEEAFCVVEASDAERLGVEGLQRRRLDALKQKRRAQAVPEPDTDAEWVTMRDDLPVAPPVHDESEDAEAPVKRAFGRYHARLLKKVT